MHLNVCNLCNRDTALRSAELVLLIVSVPDLIYLERIGTVLCGETCARWLGGGKEGGREMMLTGSGVIGVEEGGEPKIEKTKIGQ